MKRFGIRVMLMLAVMLFLGACAQNDMGQAGTSSQSAGTVPGERSSSDAGIQPAPGMGAGAKIGW